MTRGEILTRLKELEKRHSNVSECIVKLLDGSQHKTAPSEAVRIALAIPRTAKSFEVPYKDSGLFTEALNALLNI